MYLRLLFVLSLVVSILPVMRANTAERNYFLATASAGGTYYPVGVALAALVKLKLKQAHGMEMTAITTAGSAENVRLLRNKEAQFAILQGLIGYHARVGAGEFNSLGPDRMLRAVTALWPNVEQFVIRAEHVRTGTISDLLALKGNRVILGERNSGTLTSSRVLLGNLGIDVDRDYQMVYMGYGPAADALQGGEVAAVSMAAGLPTKSLVRAKAAKGEAIAILAFTEEQARRADNGLQLWKTFRIPANTYPGQPDEIPSIAQPNFLAVRSDVSENDVYLITKAIYENLSFLHSMHDATKTILVENALSGLPMPLHPGSARYFVEVGLEVPKQLLPNEGKKRRKPTMNNQDR